MSNQREFGKPNISITATPKERPQGAPREYIDLLAAWRSDYPGSYRVAPSRSRDGVSIQAVKLTNGRILTFGKEGEYYINLKHWDEVDAPSDDDGGIPF